MLRVIPAIIALLLACRPVQAQRTLSCDASRAELEMGDTVALTFRATDSGGRNAPRAAVAWASLDPDVAVVVEDTAAAALRPGEALLVCYWHFGLVDTARITIRERNDEQQPPPPPQDEEEPPPASPPASGPEPWVLEDFSTYSSTEHLRSDPRRIYGTRLWGDKNPNLITLDTSTGYGGSDRSMKYTFPSRSGSSSRCSDFTVGRDLLLPSYVPNQSTRGPRELWIEVVAKFSPNFRTRAPAEWNCNSAPDYKWLFGLINAGGRFELKIGQQGDRITVGGPGGINEDVISGYRASEFWDGQWHRYRLHFKFSSSSTAADGAIEVWIDDKKVFSRTNLVSGAQYAGDAFFGVALGRNLNQGPAEDMALWWGRVAVWRENPGW